jgi:ABC-type multidrug transport system ATPase subunit
MRIELENIGKRFNREWIFRGIDYHFDRGTVTGITGSNGSGKSTLLQVISGFLSPSEGRITYTHGDQQTDIDHLFEKVTYAAPYLDQNDHLTLREVVELQQKFKVFRHHRSAEEVIEIMELSRATNKMIQHFSSGMRQRLRLALAILAESDILLLDEPTSNLDQQGVKWFNQILSSEKDERVVVICSNSQPEELNLCNSQIDITQFKPIN